MREICALVALTMVVGCGGGDGKDGRDGAPGVMGVAGPPGMNGEDGENGADGKDGVDGVDGVDGADGTNGADGMDGATGASGGAILQGSGAPAAALGADGDIYIDTVSRDVYQKSGGAWAVITNLSGGPPGPQGEPGADGAPGEDGASVLTGSGAPAAGLGNVGDVYIDAATGDLYGKGAGGWALSGSLKGPAGDEGVDVKDTVGGVRWFALALNAAFTNTPSLIDSETHTDTSSVAEFTFTGTGQHGRLGFQTSGSYLPGGVDLVAFDFLDITATVGGGTVSSVSLYLANGDNVGCQWETTVAAGPSYSFDLWDPTSCYNESGAAGDFTLESVTTIQIGIVSNGANSRSLTVSSIGLVSN